jgi:O-antigen ligase
MKKTIKKILGFAEYLFAIVSLILYTGGVLNVVLAGGASEGDINYTQATDTDNFAIVKILYPLTYVIALLLLTRVMKKTPKLSEIFFRNPYILLVVGFAVLSVSWSELPEITISRSIALVGTTIFGIYLANRYTPKEQIVLLGHTFLAIVLLSIAFAVALPQYGIMGAIHAGAWRGIYSHKNDLGRLMALSAVIFLMQPRSSGSNIAEEFQSNFINSRKHSKRRKFTAYGFEGGKKPNLLWGIGRNLPIYFGFLMSVLLLLLARSSGAIVNLIVMMTVLIVFKITKLTSNQRFFTILALLLTIASVAVFVIPDPEVLFASMGKSSDLSGRSDLWDILFDMLSKTPLLGFGYAAFWEKYKEVLAPYNGGWAAPDAHNGYLDMALSVGFIGLFLFGISYLYTLNKGLERFRYSKTNEELWPLMLLAYVTMTNFSETGLFAYNNIFWLLYVMVGYTVISLTKKTIPALPPSRLKPPILALPEARRQERAYLAASQQRKNFNALPPARSSDRKALPPSRGT